MEREAKAKARSMAWSYSFRLWEDDHGLDSPEGLTHPQDPLEEFFATWYYMPVTEGPRG